MSKKIILNFARGHWYPRGQARLLESLQRVGYTDAAWACTDEGAIPSPTHEVSPYAFKPALFNRAKACGFRYALWCDAAVWAIKPLDPVWDYIKKTGHMLFYNGMVGNWSSDASLESFGIDRETALTINEIMGCCIGLDLENERSLEFLRIWTEKSLDGKTFPGSWTNDQLQVSQDTRVRGHRHDQTAASIIAWKLGMEKIVAHENFFQYFESPTKKPWVYGEENDMSMIFPGVVLCNQGM